MNRRRFLEQGGRTVLATAAGGGLLSARVHAQSFPTRPVRLVCGFTPGGSGDALARTLQPEVSRVLGQPLVVENRPGAASNIASEHVARAAGDGHTLLLGGSFSHSVNPVLYSNLSWDPQKDFTPIYFVGGAPSVFVVPASLPVTTLQEFIAYARREGGSINYASAGISSPGHIAGSYFNKVNGLDMVHVAYKGSGEAVRDLVAGQVQMTVTSVAAVLPLIRQGRLRPLALTSPRRSRTAPDIPGSNEAGLKDFDLDGWYGVFGPAGVAQDVITRIHEAFKAAIENPAVIEKLAFQGLEPAAPISPEAFVQFVRADAIKWRDIVKLSGATGS